ncbi:MAG TPA: hypothetical protein VMS31_21970 [Pyrinomonadaceae bacterium]|nr:hypothetical protein [Pyrinomonadaceae bacterium]
MFEINLDLPDIPSNVPPPPEALQSNLERYGYDMVVATTQDSINKALTRIIKGRMHFASEAGPPPFTVCFKQPAGSSSLVAMDPVEFFGVVGDINLMPDQADQSDKRVAALDALGFDSMFQAQLGMLGNVPANMQDFVTFDQGTSRVSYHLFFSSLTICTIDEHRGKPFWRKITQPQDQPWVFRFLINLDMRAGDQNAFNLLPPEVQARIKNLQPDSAFSLTQLMFDLDSVSLQDSPAIEGIDPKSRVYDTLSRVIIENYWQPLKESGGVMLGYGVLPANSNSPSPSIVPTDLNIVLSANRDAEGNETHNYGLYTLDYLVMSENRQLPAPGQFSWNWFGSGEINDGEMIGLTAINRNTYAHFLKDLLDKNCSWSYGGTGLPPFEIVVSNQTQVHASDGFSNLLGFRMAVTRDNFDFTIFGDVRVQGNLIRMELRAVVDSYHDPFVGLIVGRIIDYMRTVEYLLQVDQSGTLKVEMQPPRLINQSRPEFEWVANLIDLQNSMLNLDDAMTSILNGSHAWIFPGGPIVAYQKAFFSAWGDLVAYFKYDPQFE